VAEVFRTLQIRLRDSTWTIVFKSLIIVHLMIREGQGDVTLRYIAESPKRLAISNFTDGACRFALRGICVWMGVLDTSHHVAR
jgi:ANTH domain